MNCGSRPMYTKFPTNHKNIWSAQWFLRHECCEVCMLYSVVLWGIIYSAVECFMMDDWCNSIPFKTHTSYFFTHLNFSFLCIWLILLLICLKTHQKYWSVHWRHNGSSRTGWHCGSNVCLSLSTPIFALQKRWPFLVREQPSIHWVYGRLVISQFHVIINDWIPTHVTGFKMAR